MKEIVVLGDDNNMRGSYYVLSNSLQKDSVNTNKNKLLDTRRHVLPRLKH